MSLLLSQCLVFAQNRTKQTTTILETDENYKYHKHTMTIASITL